MLCKFTLYKELQKKNHYKIKSIKLKRHFHNNSYKVNNQNQQINQNISNCVNLISTSKLFPCQSVKYFFIMLNYAARISLFLQIVWRYSLAEYCKTLWEGECELLIYIQQRFFKINFSKNKTLINWIECVGETTLEFW